MRRILRSRDVPLATRAVPLVGLVIFEMGIGFGAYLQGRTSGALALLATASATGLLGSVLTVFRLARSEHLARPSVSHLSPLDLHAATGGAATTRVLLVGRVFAGRGQPPLGGPLSKRTGVCLHVEVDRLDVDHTDKDARERWRVTGRAGRAVSLVFEDRSGARASLPTNAAAANLVDIERDPRVTLFEMAVNTEEWRRVNRKLVQYLDASLVGRLSGAERARVYEGVFADGAEAVILAGSVTRRGRASSAPQPGFVVANMDGLFWGTWEEFLQWSQDLNRLRTRWGLVSCALLAATVVLAGLLVGRF